MYLINNVNAETLTNSQQRYRPSDSNSQQRYRPSDNNQNVDID
jgi:hypothetical protein